MSLIAVLNRSSAPDIDVAFSVKAVDIQMRRDFLPRFPGLPYQPVKFFGSADTLPVASGVALLATIHDNTDDPKSAAYHGFLGVPYIKIARSLGDISTLLSHEVIEETADPLCLERRTLPTGARVSYELADPVQGWTYDIEVELFGEVRQMPVSAFVLDRWFGYRDEGPTYFCPGRTDELAAGQLAPGGYIPTVNLSGVWDRVFGARANIAAIEARGARETSRFSRIADKRRMGFE